jgi:hypothetical protein
MVTRRRRSEIRVKILVEIVTSVSNIQHWISNQNYEGVDHNFIASEYE